MALEVLSARGRGKRGAPLLFVHGAFCAAWVWAEHFLPWFACNGHDAFAVSLRGHGASEGTLQGARLEDYVDDVEQVLVDLGGPAPVLVGHSLGGMVVQRLMTRRALTGAVLMASVPPHGLGASALGMAVRSPALYAALGDQLWDRSPGDAGAAVRAALFSTALAEAQARRYMARLGRESRSVMLDLLSPLLAFGWPRGRVPVLVMGSRHDPFVSEQMLRSTARRLHGELVLFEAMGHALMLDADWQRVAVELQRWLQTRALGPAFAPPQLTLVSGDRGRVAPH